MSIPNIKLGESGEISGIKLENLSPELRKKVEAEIEAKKSVSFETPKPPIVKKPTIPDDGGSFAAGSRTAGQVIEQAKPLNSKGIEVSLSNTETRKQLLSKILTSDKQNNNWKEVSDIVNSMAEEEQRDKKPELN